MPSLEGEGGPRVEATEEPLAEDKGAIFSSTTTLEDTGVIRGAVEAAERSAQGEEGEGAAGEDEATGEATRSLRSSTPLLGHPKEEKRRRKEVVVF